MFPPRLQRSSPLAFLAIVSGTVIAGGVLVLVSVLIAQYAPERVRTSVPLEET